MRPFRAFAAWWSPGRLPKWKSAVGPFQRRLRIEPLEDRLLLATVTTLDDGIGVPGTSLREAIADATPGETIDFSVTGTINLTNLGQLVVNKNLTINGPGANLLTINAFDPTPASNNGDGARVFLIDDGTAAMRAVSISGLTLTGGDTTGGGAIFNSENLTLTASTISGNAAMFGGGGIYSGSGTSLTMASSTITGNVASLGGGISTSGATLTITSSTVSGNVAASYGGGIFAQASSVTLTASTVSNNSATYGGGVFSRLGNLTLTNSTVSANQATIGGGGIFSSSADLSVKHSTITGNQANSDNNASGAGGGLVLYGPGARQLDHALVAGNTEAIGTRDDIFGFVAIAAAFSLVGDNTGASITNNGGNLIGTFAAPIDPLLGPLADNAGPTKTHALLVGSPAIDAGDPAAVAGVGNVPQVDQRGAPFVRVADGDGVGGTRIDVGAYERQAPSLVVDTLADEFDGNYAPGDRSLREAINAAAGTVGTRTITFHSSLISGGPATILLTQGELAIRHSLSILGQGASVLTIDASGNDPTPTLNDFNGSRVFNIDDGDSGTFREVNLVGLTLTGGDKGGPGVGVGNTGGAILNAETLLVLQCAVSGNSSIEGGGISNASGNVTITASTINDNSAVFGGGISNLEGLVTIGGSTIDRNTSSNGGGGIFSVSGDLSIAGSSISNNRSMFSSGGGIDSNDDDLTAITTSVISGNSAAHNGGGIKISELNGGDATIDECTIAGNSAYYGGGVSARSVALTITGSTISGNSTSFAGGGLTNAFGVVIVRHSTITNNSAPSGKGGGVASINDSVTTRTEVYSTIIAGNTGGGDVDVVNSATPNTFQSNGYNLIGSGNAIGEFVEPGDQTSVVNPLLGPLADNGGPTMTHALLPGSPAIDTGLSSAVPGVGGVPLNDQRGAPYTRVFNGDAVPGARIDKGAFELQPVGPALLGDYNHNNVVDAADYTVWRNTLGANVANFSGADGNGNGTIDAADYDVWKSHFGETLPGAGSGANSATDLDEPAALVENDAPRTSMRASDSVYDGYLFPKATVVRSLSGVGASQAMSDRVPATNRPHDDLLLALLSATTARPKGEAIDEIAAHDADCDPPDTLLATFDRVFELL